LKLLEFSRNIQIQRTDLNDKSREISIVQLEMDVLRSAVLEVQAKREAEFELLSRLRGMLAEIQVDVRWSSSFTTCIPTITPSDKGSTVRHQETSTGAAGLDSQAKP
jgi:hypothetical protein